MLRYEAERYKDILKGLIRLGMLIVLYAQEESTPGPHDNACHADLLQSKCPHCQGTWKELKSACNSSKPIKQQETDKEEVWMGSTPVQLHGTSFTPWQLF